MMTLVLLLLLGQAPDAGRLAACDDASPACKAAIDIAGVGYSYRIDTLENALAERDEKLRARSSTAAFACVETRQASAFPVLAVSVVAGVVFGLMLGVFAASIRL